MWQGFTGIRFAVYHLRRTHVDLVPSPSRLLKLRRHSRSTCFRQGAYRLNMDTLTACHWKRTREFCGSLPRLLLFRRDDYHQIVEKARKSRNSIADELLKPRSSIADGLLSLPVLRSPRETLAGIVWLNVAVHISLKLKVAARLAHDLLDWEQSFAARWTSGWLREAVRKEYMRGSSIRAIRSCLTPWTLTKSSLMPCNWHTWITNAFVHIDALHLLSNMLAFWKLGIVVAGLPGVTAIDILCMTVGASISGSAACLIASHDSRTDFIGCGASAVVNAISVAASFGAPEETIKLEMPPFEIHAKPWAVTAFSLVTDVVGVLASQKVFAAKLHGLSDPSATQSAPWNRSPLTRTFVGHAAHLAGAAFGAAYYWIMIRPRMTQAQDRRVTEEVGNDISLTGQRNTGQEDSVVCNDLALTASDDSANC